MPKTQKEPSEVTLAISTFHLVVWAYSLEAVTKMVPTEMCKMKQLKHGAFCFWYVGADSEEYGSKFHNQAIKTVNLGDSNRKGQIVRSESTHKGKEAGTQGHCTALTASPHSCGQGGAQLKGKSVPGTYPS